MRKTSRLIVDISQDEHSYLKIAFEKMEDIEDEWLSEKAKETLENIRLGKEKTVSWDEAKKRMA